MNKEHEERALAILKLLKGMRIDQAQELLSWCGGCLLRQPVVEWSRTEEDCALQKAEEIRKIRPDVEIRITLSQQVIR